MTKTAKTDRHPVDRHVGRKVCERRIALGYNQSDLGRALGISFQQVQKYEKGANRISSSKLWDTARFLQVDVGSFFAGLPGGVDGPADLTDLVQEPATPSNPSTVAISKLAPQLSVAKQKLILDLIRTLTEP